jgi:hypothetical protein
VGLLLLACGPPAAPARPRGDAPPAAPRLSVRALPLWREPVAVGADRWIAGGVRFERRGGRVRVAREVLDRPLRASRRADGWLFHTSARIWRAERFLGPLELVGAAPPGVRLARAWGHAPAVFRGSDLRLYRVDAAGQLAALDRPAGVVQVGFADPEHGVAVDVLGRRWESEDGGASWTRRGRATPMEVVESGTAPRPRGARVAPQAVLDEALAVLVARFPSLPAALPELRPLAGRLVRIHGRHVGVLARRPSSLGLDDHFCAPAPPFAFCRRETRLLDPRAGRMRRIAPPPAGGGRRAVPVRLAPDGRRALLGMGCDGREGRLCLVDLVTRRTRTLPWRVDLARCPSFAGRALWCEGERHPLRVDPRTGRAEPIRIGGEARCGPAWGGRRPCERLLPDGALLVERRVEGSGARRFWRVPVEGSPRRLEVPPRTVEVAMHDARLGLARTDRGEVHLTRDGGASWTPFARGHAACAAEGCTVGARAIGWDLPPHDPVRTEPLPSPSPGPTWRCVRGAPAGPSPPEPRLELRRTDDGWRVTVAWSDGARAEGSLRGPGSDAATRPPLRVVAASSRLALVGGGRCAGPCTHWLARAEAGDLVRLEDFLPGGFWPGRDGALVGLARDGSRRWIALRLAPDGALERIATMARFDALVEGTRFGAGFLRAAPEPAEARPVPDTPLLVVGRDGAPREIAASLAAAAQRPCTSGGSPSEVVHLLGVWPRLVGAGSTDLSDLFPRLRVHVFSDGAACLARLEAPVGVPEPALVLEARDGALVGTTRRADGARALRCREEGPRLGELR